MVVRLKIAVGMPVDLAARKYVTPTLDFAISDTVFTEHKPRLRPIPLYRNAKKKFPHIWAMKEMSSSSPIRVFA